MTKPREKLAIALDKLEAALPGMIAEYQAAGLMDLFAREEKLIQHDATPAASGYFRAKLNDMLRDAKLVPGNGAAGG